ncbi:membrane protein [Microbacterium phage Pumpernickel]|uniref:Membrane protein n=1 Tax=Microbacterium phage Pumpernickel TaxID=2885983 RepID=A0AAE8Y7S1_9CAUD|nr:membrane protein [Microbacterium phage Pumpernickel]UDL15952.1 membrane protein [Microbacterium phage Pumpernickel]
MNISHYAKAITYIAMAALTFLVTALTDNALSTEEILNLVVIVLGAVGVYLVPNFPEGFAKIAKTGIAFLTAGVVAALSFLTGGIEVTEWLQIIIAAFAAVGVYIIPNGPETPEVKPVEVVSAPALTGEPSITNVTNNYSSVDSGDASGYGNPVSGN